MLPRLSVLPEVRHIHKIRSRRKWDVNTTARSQREGKREGKRKHYSTLLTMCNLNTLADRRNTIRLCILFKINSGDISYPNPPFTCRYNRFILALFKLFSVLSLQYA